MEDEKKEKVEKMKQVDMEDGHEGGKGWKERERGKKTTSEKKGGKEGVADDAKEKKIRAGERER